MTVTVRHGTADDLAAIAALTRDRRRRLALWEPTFWNPRTGSDELHAMFLDYCIRQPGIEVRVAIEDNVIVGCVIAQPQYEQSFLDDLCVADQRWREIGTALLGSLDGLRLVTCCPRRDVHETGWLHEVGARRVAEYHVLALSDAPRSLKIVEASGDRRVPHVPLHTFAGGRIDPDADGALRLGTPTVQAVASAPMSAPIYDPGGTTTVVESISGPDLAAALLAVIDVCWRRGDQQLVVVTHTEDDDLRRLMRSAGSSVPVDVWEFPSRSQ
jgi:hypothetical protein